MSTGGTSRQKSKYVDARIEQSTIITMIGTEVLNSVPFLLMRCGVCFSELLRDLRQQGIEVSEARIRFAIKTGKVSRPRVDGSFRFDFTEENVAEIAALFARSQGVASHV